MASIVVVAANGIDAVDVDGPIASVRTGVTIGSRTVPGRPGATAVAATTGARAVTEMAASVSTLTRMRRKMPVGIERQVFRFSAE